MDLTIQMCIHLLLRYFSNDFKCIQKYVYIFYRLAFLELLLHFIYLFSRYA